MRCSTSLMSNLSEFLADWLLELLPGNSETDQQSRSLESTRLRNFATRPSIAWIPIVALVAAIGVSPTPVAQRHVPVYYVQGEQLAAVSRQASSPLDAVRACLARLRPEHSVRAQLSCV